MGTELRTTELQGVLEYEAATGTSYIINVSDEDEKVFNLSDILSSYRNQEISITIQHKKSLVHVLGY